MSFRTLKNIWLLRNLFLSTSRTPVTWVNVMLCESCFISNRICPVNDINNRTFTTNDINNRTFTINGINKRKDCHKTRTYVLGYQRNSGNMDFHVIKTQNLSPNHTNRGFWSYINDISNNHNWKYVVLLSVSYCSQSNSQ